MRPATLFKEYIWLIGTIHRHQRLTFEEINHHWAKTEMSGGLPMARSSFNRHRDAILDMFGIIIDCDKKDGYRYHIGNAEVLTHDKSVPYMDYIRSIEASGNKTALKVKINDLSNNLLRGTIGGHTKQVKKHTEALDYLLRNEEYILHID